MKPLVMFPAVTVCGSKENAITIAENRVSFHAMGNFLINGSRPVYTFVAWDAVAERIKRMKVSSKSELVIYAEMNEYVKDNVRKQTYNILSVDYLHTNEYLQKCRGKALDEDEGKKPASLSASPKQNENVEDSSLSTAPPQSTTEKTSQFNQFTQLDLEEFQSLYCN